MDTDVLSVGRVDFREGGTLDGPLLNQTLFRLRTAETEIAELKSGSTSATLQFVDFVSESETPISLAISGVLVINTGTTSVDSEDFASAVTGTTYRFGNNSLVNVTINSITTPTTTTLLTLVPGEYSRLIKLSSGWLPLFGI